MVKKVLLNQKRLKSVIGLVLISLASLTIAQEMDTDVPVGWAVVPSSVGRPPIERLTNADLEMYAGTMPSGLGVTPTWDVDGVENTIGGGDGRLVTASGDEIIKYAFMDEPLVIMASGSVGDFQVKSHKTIIGVGEGLHVKGQIVVNGVKNIILRNIRISGGSDAIEVAWGSNHIWIDHCDVSACSDGLIDFKRATDKNTVSWVRTSKHHKTMLINNGKQLEEDTDRLNTTLHHMFWDGSDTRNPRVGYGQVHILNCYYNKNSGYGIHTFWNARVRIEKNYFNNVGDAISDHKGGSQGSWPGPGYVVLIDNYTQGSGVKKTTTTDPNRIFHVDKYYMYDFIVTEDVMKVPEVVQAGATTGPEWGRIGAIPTPGQGCVSVSTSPILKWTKVGSEGPIPETSKVYFGKSNPPPEVTTVDGYSYRPEGKLDDKTVYYWKINDGKVWTFRTDASIPSPEEVGINSSLPAKKIAGKPLTIKKTGLPGQSNLLIDVRKSDNQKTYDLKGRELLNRTK